MSDDDSKGMSMSGDDTQEMQQAVQGCLGLPIQFARFLKAAVPHVVALPAAVVFRRQWGVGYATWPRFLIGLFLGWVVMLVSPVLVLHDETVGEAINKEITLSYAWTMIFFAVAFVFYTVGRILRSWRPLPGYSGFVGFVRFLPTGFWWQMLPSAVLVATALFNHHTLKLYRPFGAMCGFYGVLLAWDYIKALHFTRKMRIGANDAQVLSDAIPPPVPRRNDNPAASGEGRTGELVRIYGRNRRK